MNEDITLESNLNIYQTLINVSIKNNIELQNIIEFIRQFLITIHKILHKLKHETASIEFLLAIVQIDRTKKITVMYCYKIHSNGGFHYRIFFIKTQDGKDTKDIKIKQ